MANFATALKRADLEQSELVAIAAQLADRFRESGSGSNSFPVGELREVADAGLLAVALPLRFGGAGLGLEPNYRGSLLPVLKEIGRGNLPLGRVFEGHVNALLLAEAFGSEEQIARVAEDVLAHRRVFGVWNTGPHQSPRLTPLDEGKYRLSGGKTFATGAGRIERAIVTAALPEGGWQMCLVPLSEVEMQIDRGTWEPLGMEASESYAVQFPDVVLTPDDLIGMPGDYYAEPMFTSGALRFCAVQLGGAQALFDAVCRFLNAHGRGDDALQLQRVGQMAVLMESGGQWLRRAGEWLETSHSDSRLLGVQAQMMRIATEEICSRVIQLVEVSVGARGLAAAEPFSRMLRDLQMYLRQGGYDHAFQVVGRKALEEGRRHV